MALWFLFLYSLYAALAFGGRALLQLRRRGSPCFSGISGRPLSAEWIGGMLFIVASVLVLAAPLLDLAGVLRPVVAPDHPEGYVLGFVLFFAGLVGTLLAQGMMGSLWRVGVDKDERTELVNTGPFALVQDPIFSAMIPAFLGLTLLAPNIAALAGLVALIVAVEIRVRLVEKPYLLRTHSTRYAAYASRVGRFVPGIGCLKTGRAR